MKQGRNHSVDILRLVGAFAVICLHNFSASGVWAAEEIVAVTRFAVPLFFLFSGYFAAHFTVKRKLWQILKIFLLGVAGNLLYLARELLPIKNRYFWIGRFREIFTPAARKTFLLWNESPLSGHLWFLSALLYVLLLDLIFSFLLSKWKHRRPALWCVTGLLLFGGLVLYRVRAADPSAGFPLYCYRNYLFFGLPFFLAGKLLRDSDRWHKPLPLPAYLLGIPVLCLTALLEYHFTGAWELYLSSIGMTLLLSHLAVNHPLQSCPAPAALAAWLGQHTSLLIYLLHIFFLDWVRGAYYAHFPWQYGFGLYHFIPLAVFLLTTAVSALPPLCLLAVRKLAARRKSAPKPSAE